MQNDGVHGIVAFDGQHALDHVADPFGIVTARKAYRLDTVEGFCAGILLVAHKIIGSHHTAFFIKVQGEMIVRIITLVPTVAAAFDTHFAVVIGHGKIAVERIVKRFHLQVCKFMATDMCKSSAASCTRVS